CYAPMAISATASSPPASGQTSGQTVGSMMVESSVGSGNQLPLTLPVGQTAFPGAISYDSIAEPTVIDKTPIRDGIALRWTDPSIVSASHRIEASSSIQPIWTLASIVPPGVTTFTYNPPIKAEWA